MPFWPFRQKSDLFQKALKTHIDRDFSVFACGKDAPDESTIRAFEKSIGFRLPDDFRRFSMSKLGGVYVDVKESLWPRPKEFEVGPFWSFLYGLHVYGFGKDIPESMNIRLATEKFRNESKTNYVPCLCVIGDANIFCFDQDRRLRRWDHEIGEAPEVKSTFAELFDQKVGELRKRKDRKLAERQTPPPVV